MKFDRRLIQMLREDGFALLLTLLCGLFSALLIVVQARILSIIINSVFLDGNTLQGVMHLFWLWMGVILLRSLVVFGSETASTALAVRIKSILRDQLVAHLYNLGPAYARGEKSGELITTVTSGVEALDAYFSQYLPQLILAALIPMTILLSVFPIDLLTAVVMVVTFPLIPVFMVLIGNTAEALTRRQWRILSRLSAYFLDTLQGLTTLKELNQSRLQTDRIASVSERYRQVTMSVLRVTFLSAFVLELVSTISTAVIAVEIGLRLLYGEMVFVDAFFILVIAPEFYYPLRALGMRFHAGMSGVSAARRIFEILDQNISSFRGGISDKMTVRAKGPAGVSTGVDKLSASIAERGVNLQFRDVICQYPDRSSAALDGVSIDIQAGQNTALIGPSGAGKSTILQLLLGFITPNQGQILVNEVPLEDIVLEKWLTFVSWMPQSPYLFHDSIAENIRLGDRHASKERVREAASFTHLNEFIDTLPMGYETIIGEKGARLSGGQAQALALARAFLADTPLLLLDEPTSHLDPEQEENFQRTTLCLAQQPTRSGVPRTVITIAHRLPTVFHADQIIMLQHGTIKAMGSHTSLVQRSGEYVHFMGSPGMSE